MSWNGGVGNGGVGNLRLIGLNPPTEFSPSRYNRLMLSMILYSNKIDIQKDSSVNTAIVLNRLVM